MTEYDAARFLKSITKPPAAAPSPAAKTEPTVPQKPVVLPIVKQPEDKEAIFKKRMDDELGGTVELLMHPEFFSETGDDTTVQNAVHVFQWVMNQGKWVSRATVSEAVKALKNELTPLRKPEPISPSKQPPAQPVVSEIRVTTTTPSEPVDTLPPLSTWVWKQLGSNKMLTRADVNKIKNQLYSNLYRNNKYGDEFRARVNAILSR